VFEVRRQGELMDGVDEDEDGIEGTFQVPFQGRTAQGGKRDAPKKKKWHCLKRGDINDINIRARARARV
jgi:hypothetical protein